MPNYPRGSRAVSNLDGGLTPYRSPSSLQNVLFTVLQRTASSPSVSSSAAYPVPVGGPATALVVPAAGRGSFTGSGQTVPAEAGALKVLVGTLSFRTGWCARLRCDVEAAVPGRKPDLPAVVPLRAESGWTASARPAAKIHPTAKIGPIPKIHPTSKDSPYSQDSPDIQD